MMTSKKQIILAFDVYGTLLSTESIAKQLAEHFGQEKAGGIAAEWRKYQLEYTWRLNSMGKYRPFSSVTRDSLQHVLAEASLSLSDKDVDKLMDSYNSLSIFPDVPPLFTHLKENAHIQACVFSNGTRSMITTSLTQSPDLSPHAHHFKQIVVVEPVKRFKPDPQVYQHLCKEVGKKEGEEGEVWLVSGNPFDIVGANSMGLRTCWVDRAKKGWSDRLGEEENGTPTVIVNGLDEVVKKVENFLAKP